MASPPGLLVSSAGLHARIVIARPRFHLDVDLSVAPGEVLAIVGPNGAGKSTILNAVSGLVPLSHGLISLSDVIFDDPATQRFVPSAQRQVGVVFQDFRLFAHLNVRDNIAFGARARGASRQRARASAEAWIHRFGLDDFAQSRPAALSGGQAQRTALARALAGQPAALLLDEPLAALDTRSRTEVHSTLREQIADFAGPTLMITHDPLDAMVLADRVIVIEEGRVRQEATPGEIAQRPTTPYVAAMLGLNLYRGSLRGGVLAIAEGGLLTVCGATEAENALAALRPAAITMHRWRPSGLSARNSWPVRVDSVVALADRVRVHTSGSPDALVDVTPAAAQELALMPGAKVWLSAKATDILAYETRSNAPVTVGPRHA